MKAALIITKMFLQRTSLILAMALLNIPLHAQKTDSLQINIWADKLICTTEMEDATDDGNGNEAFVQYHWAIVNADNGAIFKSGIHANLDIKMLFSGTTYPLNKMIIGEYPIRENDILVVIPVAWEQDRTATNVLPAFNQQMSTCISQIAGQLPSLYSTFRTNYNKSIAGYYEDIYSDISKIMNISWGTFKNLPSFNSLLDPVRGSAATRPIGIGSNFEFTPVIFTFSRALLRNLYHLDPPGSLKGDILQLQARYVEGAVGNVNNRANYTVVISVQRKIITPGVIVKPPINKIPFHIGIWQGTWDVHSDPFLKMNIRDDGFFQLFDGNNNPKQTGTYTLNNGQFIGLVTLNGKKYELSGVLDRITSTLSGTWRYNDGFTSKSGTWSVKK